MQPERDDFESEKLLPTHAQMRKRQVLMQCSEPDGKTDCIKDTLRVSTARLKTERHSKMCLEICSKIKMKQGGAGGMHLVKAIFKVSKY